MSNILHTAIDPPVNSGVGTSGLTRGQTGCRAIPPRLLCQAELRARGMAAEHRKGANRVMPFCQFSRLLPNGVAFPTLAVVVGLVVLSIGMPVDSWAQATVVIGGSGQPAVEVNLGVLDQPRGRYPGQSRRLLMPGERPAEVVRLRKPGLGATSSGGGEPPRLTLRRPATPSRARAVQQASRRTAVTRTPAPVTQRIIPAPTPTPQATRTPARKAPPPPPKAPPTVAKSVVPPPPVRAPTPKQTAAVQQPPKAPPTPPIAKAPPPPPPPIAKAVPLPKAPPPQAKVAPPPAAPAAPQVAMAKPAPQSTRAPSQPPREKRQVASLPRIPLPRNGGHILRVDFLGASTRLNPDAERKLGSLAATMAESDGRLQLKAYAGGTGETLSSSRRLSLSRALAVRSYLIEQGIRSTRIDVRALGRAEDSGPPERVDIVLLTQ